MYSVYNGAAVSLWALHHFHHHPRIYKSCAFLRKISNSFCILFLASCGLKTVTVVFVFFLWVYSVIFNRKQVELSSVASDAFQRRRITVYRAHFHLYIYVGWFVWTTTHHSQVADGPNNCIYAYIRVRAFRTTSQTDGRACQQYHPQTTHRRQYNITVETSRIHIYIYK